VLDPYHRYAVAVPHLTDMFDKALHLGGRETRRDLGDQKQSRPAGSAGNADRLALL
jgi:hypothetical protein